jgi:hypothetical protein
MKTLYTFLITVGLYVFILPGLYAEKPVIKLSLNTPKGQILNFYTCQESEIEEPLIDQLTQRAQRAAIITPENLFHFTQPEKEVNDLNLDTARIFTEIVYAE